MSATTLAVIFLPVCVGVAVALFLSMMAASREAERTIRGMGVANSARKATIDKLSAVILLQSYLDSQ